MSASEILVPDIGDFAEVDVIEVHVKAGQELQENDPMITLENDKASMDLPATVAGTVKEVKVKVGDKVSEGSLILVLEAAASAKASDAKASEAKAPAVSAPDAKAAESGAKADKPAPAAPAEAAPSAPRPALAPGEVPSFASVHASPTIRRLAREQGVDLNQVKGTGRKGRITREDVVEYMANAKARSAPSTASKAAASTSGIPAIPTVDFAKFGPIEVQAIGRIKRLTGAAMTRSWLNIPHVTHNDEADVTELEAFRKSIKATAEKRGTRVSLLGFAMKAVVATLKAFPSFNASLDVTGENLVLKQYYHLGIAVDTPNGLVVPVIRDVDQKSVFDLSDELMSISKKARDNKLALSDVQGGTFTLSSLGGIGGTTFSPIINAPEVAILGMTRSKMQPVWDGKAFVPRLMQPLSLSYDHRAIDGAEAARFCRHLATLLEDIRHLLL